MRLFDVVFVSAAARARHIRRFRFQASGHATHSQSDWLRSAPHALTVAVLRLQAFAAPPRHEHSAPTRSRSDILRYFQPGPRLHGAGAFARHRRSARDDARSAARERRGRLRRRFLATSSDDDGRRHCRGTRMENTPGKKASAAYLP